MDRQAVGEVEAELSPGLPVFHAASQESARVTPRANIKEEKGGGGGGRRVIRREGRWQEVTGFQRRGDEQTWEVAIGVKKKRRGGGDGKLRGRSQFISVSWEGREASGWLSRASLAGPSLLTSSSSRGAATATGPPTGLILVCRRETKPEVSVRRSQMLLWGKKNKSIERLLVGWFVDFTRVEVCETLELSPASKTK